MARYDIYESPDGVGYVLDVQTDLLEGLSTRIVVPLLPSDMAPQPAQRLNPVFEIGEEPHILVTQFLASVPLSLLRTPAGNLSDRSFEITNALDMVFQGF